MEFLEPTARLIPVKKTLKVLFRNSDNFRCQNNTKKKNLERGKGTREIAILTMFRPSTED